MPAHMHTGRRVKWRERRAGVQWTSGSQNALENFEIDMAFIIMINQARERERDTDSGLRNILEMSNAASRALLCWCLVGSLCNSCE